jgi:serine/threonine protein phosphatase PrpC
MGNVQTMSTESSTESVSSDAAVALHQEEASEAIKHPLEKTLLLPPPPPPPVEDPFAKLTAEDIRKETAQGECAQQQYVYAMSSMKGIRPRMEDAHIVRTSLPVHGHEPLRDHSLFCVFDGHGGDFTSRFLEEMLTEILSRRKELMEYAALPPKGRSSRSDVNGILLLKKAITKSFSEIDCSLLPQQRERNRNFLKDVQNSDHVERKDNIMSFITYYERSGSTAIVVLLTPSHIVCANVGDSRAILRRASTAVPLSFDHKPSNIPERLRIERAGGSVKGKRIDGDLAVSRAFGDFVHKNNTSLASSKQKVTCAPDVSVCRRDSKNDQFLVLACDGIWDVISNDECSNLVNDAIVSSKRFPQDLATICEDVIDESFHERRSRDNLTVMIIGFRAGLKICENHSTSSFSLNYLLGIQPTRRKDRKKAIDVKQSSTMFTIPWMTALTHPFDDESKRILDCL